MTTRLDSYCGCVEQRCQYFESARPSVQVKFKGEVRGWGEHPEPDPKKFLVGFGNGQQVLSARLERRDMSRHMTRCFLDHLDELPQTFEFSLKIPGTGKTRTAQVQLKTSVLTDAQRCVEQVLRQQLYPLPPSQKTVSVEGALELTLGPS